MIYVVTSYDDRTGTKVWLSCDGDQDRAFAYDMAQTYADREDIVFSVWTVTEIRHVVPSRDNKQR